MSHPVAGITSHTIPGHSWLPHLAVILKKNSVPFKSLFVGKASSKK